MPTLNHDFDELLTDRVDLAHRAPSQNSTTGADYYSDGPYATNVQCGVQLGYSAPFDGQWHGGLADKTMVYFNESRPFKYDDRLTWTDNLGRARTFYLRGLEDNIHLDGLVQAEFEELTEP